MIVKFTNGKITVSKGEAGRGVGSVQEISGDIDINQSDFIISIPDIESKGTKYNNTDIITFNSNVNVLNNADSITQLIPDLSESVSGYYSNHSFIPNQGSKYTVIFGIAKDTEVTDRNYHYLAANIYENGHFYRSYPSMNPDVPTEFVIKLHQYDFISNASVSEKTGYRFVFYHIGSFNILKGDSTGKITTGWVADSTAEQSSNDFSGRGTFYVSEIAYDEVLSEAIQFLLDNDQELSDRISQVDEGLRGSFIAG